MAAIVGQAQNAFTVITNLEPLAGAGLAINLAYLALDRFRYRSAIEPEAEKQCKLNDEKAAFPEFHDLDPVKELKWLASRETSRVHVPRGRGAILYRYGYRKHQDVRFAIGAAILCGFVMVAGVAVNVGRWSWVEYLTYPVIAGALFYGCLLSLIVPAVMVVLGRKCAAWGKSRIEQCRHQVAIHLKALAANAEPPRVPAGPPRSAMERAEVYRRQPGIHRDRDPRDG